MLEAHADREGFGFEVDAAFMEHRESVAGAVADRQHDMLGGDMFAAGQHHAAHLATHLAIKVGLPIDEQILDAAIEADFAAERLDAGAHVLDHPHQTEGADMRFADV